MSRRHSTQDYWDAYEGTLERPAGSSARNLERIRGRLAAGERVEDDSPLVEAPPRRAAAAGLVVLGKSASASVGIAGAVLLSIKLAAVGWAGLEEPPRPPASTSEPSAPAVVRSESPRNDPSIRTPAPPLESAAPNVGESPPTPDSPRPVDRETTRPRSTTPPDAAAADRLRAEVALMDRARAALDRGDANALWSMMDEHARRFPDGALREEREAWRAVAACRLTHANAAARATRFLDAHPRSAQAAKVRRACDGLLVDRVTESPSSSG